MVPVADRSFARGTWHVRSRKPSQKSQSESAAGQTNGLIRLKLLGPIAIMGGYVLWGGGGGDDGVPFAHVRGT